MAGSPAGRRVHGVLPGSVVALAFGLVFILVNSGRLGSVWGTGVQMTGALVALVLLAALLRLRRADSAPAAPGPPWFADRRFLVAVGIEAVALFGGLFVIGRVFGPVFNVPWIAFVVGAHFFALGRIWNLARFHVLGAVMVALSAAGFAMAMTGTPRAGVDLVAGVGSGAALFAWVAFAVVEQARTGTGRGTGAAGSP